MNARLKSILRMTARWIPALIVLGVLVFAGVRYKQQLVDWVSVIPGSERWLAKVEGAASRPASQPASQPASRPTSQPASQPVTTAATDHDHEGIAYYTCSMHPSVRSNDPGTCPICAMDLTPVTNEEVATGMFVVDDGVRQLIGVKTAKAERKQVTRQIRAVGNILYDETSLSDVTLKFKGWIGDVYVDYTGAEVKTGDPLFTIYSPEVLAVQEELLDANERSGQRGESTLMEPARRRLKLWDIDDEQIDSILREGSAREYLTIKAPLDGTVIEKNIVQGSVIGEGTRLYRIADLSRVWIEIDVYEADQPHISVGQAMRIQFSYLPDSSFEARVAYIYPYLNKMTRTVRARLEAQNPERLLKPGMYIQADVDVPLGDQLVVPEGAVIYAGKKRIVFLDRGEGKLQPKEVQIGDRAGDWIVVREGLEEGDIVVSSGNFLIASESKLKAAVESW